MGESARQAVVVSLPNLSPSLKLLSISGLEEGAWQIFSTSCYQRCTDKDPKHKAVSNDDIVHFNTSGTTDLPKAVVHNWRSLNASFKINRDTRKDRNIDTSHSVILVASPLCVTSGFRQAMEVLSKGYTLILHKAFEPEKIYRDIEHHSIIGLLLVP